MSSNRTRNSMINLITGGSFQILYLLVSFAGRTVFIYILNADYLGINGLFSNILTVLSFSELGISSAIIYNMYRPVEEGDTEKMKALLNLYRKAYNCISIIVVCIGMILTPVLPYIINSTLNITENLIVIYWLFLGNTASSYVLSYRKLLFTAYQKDYIVILTDRTIQIVLIVIQLFFLFFTHNFYLYLVFQIVATLVSNIMVHILAHKKFPQFIDIKSSVLSWSEKKGIAHDIAALFCYKVGAISLNATDNILITRIINVTTVGLCSNYVMIINAVETIIARAFSGVVASIGNLNASDNRKEKLNVFNELTTFIYWIYGFCSIELVLLLNKTIAMWIGNSYLLPDSLAVSALVLTFYIFGTNVVASNFRTTMGYFQEGKFTPVIAGVLNIVLSIFLGNRIGIVGIYFATSIARILTFGIIDPVIVCKKGLKADLKYYYIKQILFFLLTVINVIFCNWIISFVNISGFIGLFIKAIIIAIAANGVYIMLLYRTKSFQKLLKRLKIYIRR